MSNMSQSQEDQGARQGDARTFMLRSGLWLGSVMSLQFLSILLYEMGGLAALVYLVLTICVPALMVVLARRYRREYKGDVMTYAEAVVTMSGMYLLAMIVALVAYYIGYSVLWADPKWMGMMADFIEQWVQQSPSASESEIESLRGLLSTTPKQLALQTALSAMFLGMMYIYIAAFFVRKSR